MILRFVAAAALLATPLGAAGTPRIDLSGTWTVQLDRDLGGGPIFLPGSLDQGAYGVKVTTPDKGWLTRPYKYEGPARYRRRVVIPETWRGRHIVLFLERPHYQTEVRVDGRSWGTANSLSTPHEYDVTAALPPGPHELEVTVDNTYRIPVGQNAHSVTEHTQTNWNGIVGRIELLALPAAWIDDLAVYPDPEANSVRVTGVAHGSGEVVARVGSATESARVSGKFELTVRGAVVFPWDERQPRLNLLLLRFGEQEVELPFGMRQIATRGTQFLLNGRVVFLRGTLECNIFPLTGYPPTSEEEWARLFRIARSYGLNSFRFHSYCPPEAAFRAADYAGFLLQVELPVWSNVAGKDPALNDYMRAEGYRILRAYGNHPSFTMLCLGNELSGDDRFLDALVAEFKAADPRRLYTFSSDHRRRAPGPTSDYYVTHQTSAGRLRINGTQFGRTMNGTNYDFSASVNAVPMPLVAHELGQWAVYPSFDEIAKYTGVLKARNLEVFRDQLAARGMIDQARDFQVASGRFAWSIYKEDMEAALRTPGMGGYFLLQLQDFPGQGEALVGLLDSFWESKGIFTPEEFRSFSGDVVPLARFDKFVWTAGETFVARAEVANYGPSGIGSTEPRWTLGSKGGAFPAAPIPAGGVTALGEIRAPLAGLSGPMKLTVGVHAGAVNSWNLWVYPDTIDLTPPSNVTVATTWPAARDALAQGRRVLLHTLADAKLEPERFLPVFWSKAWGGPSFTAQPSHLGILCDPAHPALARFPTESHKDFQWWELTENSRVFTLNDTPAGFRPIVQVIDDFHRNHKLGSVFEAAVGSGRLLATSYDLTNLAQRPVARQMLHSLLQYTATFDPKDKLSPDEVARTVNPAP